VPSTAEVMLYTLSHNFTVLVDTVSATCNAGPFSRALLAPRRVRLCCTVTRSYWARSSEANQPASSSPALVV
jgi:hypothetical protein